MRCKNDAKQRSGVKDLRQNKHQLLHRITSIKTPLIYNTRIYCEYGKSETQRKNDDLAFGGLLAVKLLIIKEIFVHNVFYT